MKHLSRIVATAAFAVAALSAPVLAFAAQGGALHPIELHDALAATATDNSASIVLAGRIRQMAGGMEKLQKGMPPKGEFAPTGELTVAWAVEISGASDSTAPVVATDDPNLPTVRLTRVGKTDVFAASVSLPKGFAGHWSYQAARDGLALAPVIGSGQYEEYPRNPEEIAQAGVPKGTVTKMPDWHSKIIEGTTRSWWVYVPAQYSADKPASLIVCQDGGGPRGWLPTILDNMIAKGELPPIVAVFIEPGKFDDGKSNRSVEYDTLSDKYAQMLLQEMLPEVEKTTKLSANPDDRAIYGVSSGGICAFTVAWEHPEAFHKVSTCVGSFTNLQGGPTGTAGGNTYPAIIRHQAGWDQKGTPKPIKMFQTDGANDLDNAAGSWPLANQEISKALDFGGYTHKFVFGNGFHGDRFGRYMMPTGLRYLWNAPK